MDPSKQTAHEDESNVLENPVLFWKEQLEVDNPLLKIPADFPRSSTTTCRVNHFSFSLPVSCLEALKQLSARQNTTLFTILFAAYNTLLYRYTNQAEIVVGMPVPEDTLNAAGELVGTRHNIKIFRTDLSADPGFNELAARVHQVISTASRHKDIAYHELEEVMRSELGIDYMGLYNVIFSFGGTGHTNNQADDQAQNLSAGEKPAAVIELALHLEETAPGLKGIITYNSTLFEPATIDRFAKHYEVLLAAIILNPRQAISKLQILTGKERHELSYDWNSSKVNYPIDKCIHELFEERARKTPDAIALVFENSKLTYAELNARANRVAHYLAGKGVNKETLVPVCVPRSFEMIIGILAILKAGGAYVPIDPDYPHDRIAYMLEDTNASIVICNNESKPRLRSILNIDFVELSADASLLHDQPVSNLNTGVSSGNLAYIIYTSGSTGKPKGVMIEHRALADHCYGVIESAGLIFCKSFALFSPLVFDAGHSLIHSAFILGAALHVLPEELILSSEKVKAYVDNNDIDCLKIVPSLWLSYASVNRIVLAKKVIIFGGEAFNLSILTYLKKQQYNGDVYNHYGPTEVTIGKCIYKVNLDKTYHTVPIGKPFSNTRLFILDDNLQLTPAGIQGELYIAGDGLARGYLNQPALTAEKFILNPFSEVAPCRIYKTGDKVKWLNDGNIEYLGRADEQVKIQGHRIELGEIEGVLLQSGLVSQAVVLANADNNGGKRLAAYVVPSEIFNREAILSFLRKKLPEYMVPVICIELKKLPLTQNGKINKKELERLQEVKKTYLPPRDGAEELLASIWQEILNVEKISIDDDFFELGGNSIQAVILLTKIKRAFHKNFPLAVLLRARTISKLAAALKTPTEAVAFSSSLVVIQPNGSMTPLFGIHAGLGDILFYESLSKHLGPDQPFYGLQAKGLNGTERPSAHMEKMAGEYISDIRKVQPEGPYYLAGYCLGARIAFEMAQQLTRAGQKVALVASLNGISPTYRRKADRQSARQRIAFFYRRLPRLIFKRAVNLVFLWWTLSCGLIFKLYLLFKKTVPAHVARLHVGRSLHLLQAKYKPVSYPGSMVIFRSPGIFTDPYLGWESFVQGEIKIFDIPGQHQTRRDIMNEPFVRFTARELKNVMESHQPG